MNRVLDIEKKAQRNIRSGEQYNALFPPAESAATIINHDGGVKDTVKYMDEMSTKYAYQTSELAPQLRGKSIEDTARNIWNFCYHHIQYKLDRPNREELRQPARTWADRQEGVDCDCYSIFISSILKNLGIDHAFRIAKYSGDWQHVYVVVPDGKREYIIDCVLNRFNTEKPYSDKFDHKMKTTLNGIPIAMLSGIADSSMDELITGEHFSNQIYGLGTTASQDLEAIKSYLIKTREAIANNPDTVAFQGGAKNIVPMIDYAISYWDNPVTREQALAVLEKEGERLDRATGLSGTDLGGVGKFFKSVGTAVKTTAQKTVSTVKTGAQTVKTAVQNVAKNVAPALSTAVKAVVRYNPLTIAARGGFLLAFKVNLFGWSSKLAPGYSGDAAAKVRLDKIINLFTKLGGKAENLKNSILQGAQKRQFLGIGLGDPATATAIISAAVPLIEAATAIEGKSENKESFIQRITSWLTGAFKKGLNPAEVSESAAQQEGEQSAASPASDAVAVSDEQSGNWFSRNPGTAVGMGIGTVAVVATLVHLAGRKKSRGALSGAKPAFAERSKASAGRPGRPRKKQIKELALS